MSSDAISPIDGRYASEAAPLGDYFSESALNRERVHVELAYLRLLVKLRIAPKSQVPEIMPSMERIKKLERKTGHDMKAVEIYLRDKLIETGHKPLAPFVHLGLTSEDTNSLAFALLLKSALEKTVIPALSELAWALARLAKREASTTMAARTHGRPALPTTFGKEMAVFAYRLAERTSSLKRLTPMAKFSGAVGTYASFMLLGDIDWTEELANFVKGFGVEPAPYSTQVVPGERLSDVLHLMVNINQLVVSLSRDLWIYQAMDLLHFVRPGKVSSSTMPQKVNPVDIENAEGQGEISNALLTFIAYRLQLTRMQRDLSDSVIRRMVGQGLAHSLIGVRRLTSSLALLEVDRKLMKSDLERHPEIFSEREQIRLRLKGDERGYEKVKSSIERGEFHPTGHQVGDYLGSAKKLAKACPDVVGSLLGPSS